MTMIARRAGLAFAALIALTPLAACTTMGTLDALEPGRGVSVVRDVTYAPGERGTLDVYTPAAGGKARPVVVFFYGGNWNSGRKADYAWVGKALARDGYVVVIPDYRVYPQVRWPEFLRDSAQAVRWSRDHAARHGGDPTRIALMGHSAGAYNALELAVDGRWLGEVGLDPARDLRAVVGLSGPYDFLPLRSEELKTIFGPEASRADTQPITHVTGAGPPMLLAVGDRDDIVDPGNTERMATAVRTKGGQVETVHYPRLGHAMTIGAFARPLAWMAPVKRDVLAFLKRRL